MGPSRRELRDKVAVQRRTLAQDVYGGVEGPWTTMISERAAKLVALTPRRGASEEVIAKRLQATALWDCWLVFDTLTSAITAEDRVVDLRAGVDANGVPLRVFNVRWAKDIDGRRTWWFMQLEEGVAEG